MNLIEEVGRVLITGGSGFVGAHVANRFLRAGYEVVIFDRVRPHEGLVHSATSRVKFVEGDVMNRHAVADTLDIYQIRDVVHCAAIVGPNRAQTDPEYTVQVNVEGTMNVLAGLRTSGGRLTYLSTATLYGQQPDVHPLQEDDPPNPVSIYDATKLMGETLVHTYGNAYGIDTVSIRPAFVYGPGSAVGSYYLDRIVGGEPVNETSGADHLCDFTYVVDLANGIYLAHTTRPIKSRVFNISGGQLHSRSQLVELIRKIVPGARIHLGPGVAEGAHVRGPCDISRAQAELGYVPQYTLEQGLKEWHAWLVEHEVERPREHRRSISHTKRNR